MVLMFGNVSISMLFVYDGVSIDDMQRNLYMIYDSILSSLFFQSSLCLVPLILLLNYCSAITRTVSAHTSPPCNMWLAIVSRFADDVCWHLLHFAIVRVATILDSSSCAWIFLSCQLKNLQISSLFLPFLKLKGLNASTLPLSSTSSSAMLSVNYSINKV